MLLAMVDSGPLLASVNGADTDQVVCGSIDRVRCRSCYPGSDEVTTSSRTSRLRGLEAFRKRFSPIRTLLVGADGVTLADFLSVPAGHWFDAP